MLEVQPRLAHPYYLKACVLARLGDRVGALRRLDIAVAISPEFKEAVRLRSLLSRYAGWRTVQEERPEPWEAAVLAAKKGDLHRLRSALLDFSALAGADPSAELFKACCILSDYESACGLLAELTAPGAARQRLELLNIADPWDMGYPMPSAYFREHARKLKEARTAPGMEGYLAYLKATLDLNFHGAAEAAALRGLDALKDKNGGKYGFAGYITAGRRLSDGLIGEAVRDYRKLLASGYLGWGVRCRLGEALLCGGDSRRGLAEFKAAYRAASGSGRDSIRAWEGEMLLFLKRYRQALAVLKTSGDRYASCWRGAAYLESGKARQALVEFKKAAASVPDDVEARLWLGEAYRRLGRGREALVELNAASQLKPRNIWVYLNRALLLGGLGDSAGMARNFRLAVSTWPEPVAAAREALGIRPETVLRRKDIPAVIASTLKLCGGFRRTDRHFLRLVLGPRRS